MGGNCGKEQGPYQPQTYPGVPGRYGHVPYHPVFAPPGSYAAGLPHAGPVYADYPPGGYDPSLAYGACHSSRPSVPSVPSAPPLVEGWPVGGTSGGTSSTARPPTGSSSACRYGVECTDFGEEHRKRFTHPEGILMACQYGAGCYRKNLEHLKQFVHPGDRHYRMGMVHFPTRKGVRVKPQFPTLRDLFNYCDPDESGNISMEEFQDAWHHLCHLPPDIFGTEGNTLEGSPVEAWKSAAGDERSHLTFAQFARWASDVKIKLPVGVDPADAQALRPCRFEYGKRCPCANFKAGASNHMCECGHKSCAHLSDVALMSLEEQEVLTKLKRRALGRASTKLFAPERKPGFSMVTNKEVLAALQKILSDTHKATDNWTRDRGCALHGRHHCDTACIFKHRASVPTGFELTRAERNRNAPLWHVYATTRSAIKQETQSGTGPSLQRFSPLSAFEVPLEEPLDPEVNEWRLLHGSGWEACKGICGSNFRLKLAGTGATWKTPGMESGQPLYGYGVYLAERSTKADEYAEEIHGGLKSDEGCHTMLVCRVVGGLCRVVDTNEFDADDLRRDILDGPHHSVLGDRVVKLGKPYREVVVHDNNQIFPEFILYYKRLGMPD